MFDRLTHRTQYGIAYTKIPANKSSMVDVGECYTGRIVDRIAAYEDSGLSPEQAQELAQAKAEGRLVVLPAKVGDTIYFINRYKNKVDSRLITGIRQNTNGAWQAIGGLLCFPFSEFGKTVFLSCEEAEKAIGGGEK